MSGRKRKSLWDSKEETENSVEFGKHDARHGREIHSSHHAKWSDVEAKNASNSNNGSRWSSSEIWQDNNGRKDYNEMPKTERAGDGDKSYSRSPGLTGRGKHNHSPPSEIYWSQSHRYQRSRSSSRSKGRAGSRSRSRSRGRDREMDKDTEGIQSWSSGRDRGMDKDTHDIRSWSRGRDRDMDKDTEYIQSRGRDRDMDRDTNDTRSWSRGRDRDMDRDIDGIRSWGRGRDRDVDKDRDTNWSRSTLSDHRREYNGMGDRKSVVRASSQLCRDFSVGMCRRGDQCRFLHDDNLNLSHEKLERERAEFRGRHETNEAFSADNGRPRYRTLDKVSNYDRSNRSSSFDHDHRRQPYKNVNIPCKYFAMGRCHRDDCRFSHDHPGGGAVKEKLQYDRYDQHADDENTYWNGPKWGDAHGVSDMNNNDRNNLDTRKTNYVDRTAKKQASGILDQDWKDEKITWDGPTWEHVTSVSDVARPNQWVDSNAGGVSFPEPPVARTKTDERCGNSMDLWNRTQNGSNTKNVDTVESTHVATFDGGVWVDAQGSHVQTAGGSSLQTCEKVIEGASTQQLINNVGHPLVSENSYVQQSDGMRGNNIMPNDNSNAVKGVNISGNTRQFLLPEQILNHNSGSSISMPSNINEADQRNVIPVSPVDGHEADPNRSDKQLLYPNQQDESKNFFKDCTNKQQVFESEVCQVDPSLPQNDMTNYQVAAITNLSASLNEIFSNGKQLPELYAVLNPKSSTDLLTSLSCSASVNSSVAATIGQPNQTTMFQGQHVPIGAIELGKHDRTDVSDEQRNHGTDSKHCEEKPAPFENTRSSTDRITEGANNNKIYELGEPKPLDQFLLPSINGPDPGKIEKIGSTEKAFSPTEKLLKPDINIAAHQNVSVKSESCKPEEGIPFDNANPEGRVREGNSGKDEKEMRLFKVALVEYVKEILKPVWKEGQMSREVHKSIVKKVVDKVTGTIQGGHIPKTQEKVDQYLACSKPKLTKLVQAYTERLLKS
ncbi:zinc finger CCCH domain-containing protein 38 [Daucus carota subsp. sativus]|uniref:zinc finger CCCH domain-containing protein 38 n=1 Tax=Daucus carota subsp. sativus TaxID=79200 RepID=UPI0007EF3D9A|nr:PREDICTED: zinc finger CCCH domain-containing protein 38-like isoform X1 [Daucus carota subsp. sativus]XP_017241781.1 PREDICTED: zinc finger CCCH domain-containing protein 38-like isoform X2 [Daucus carota subsp. sativus]